MDNKGFRTRREESANYSSIFINGKTLRFAIDKNKPITELRWPEFFDVGINSKCFAGCPTCYTSATSKGTNFPNIIEKINRFFGPMTLNQRAYQVALGGSGEATIHPDFIEVLKTFHDLQIVPNYTTNGMHLNDSIIEATIKFAGGVALSLHPQLEKIWRGALNTLNEAKIRTNVHVIISDKESIDKFYQQYNEFKDRTEYFVLLAYMSVGFGGGANSKLIDYDYFDKILKLIPDHSKLAFSSNFYKFLLNHKEYKVSVYQPEAMSKYLIFNDKHDNMIPSIYNNSFECKPVNWENEMGCQIKPIFASFSQKNP